MKDVMGLIFTGENDIHLGELTSLRAVAALPIAGRYRVIDFQLSSMVHSGIKNVGEKAMEAASRGSNSSSWRACRSRSFFWY